MDSIRMDRVMPDEHFAIARRVAKFREEFRQEKIGNTLSGLAIFGAFDELDHTAHVIFLSHERKE